MKLQDKVMIDLANHLDEQERLERQDGGRIKPRDLTPEQRELVRAWLKAARQRTAKRLNTSV